MRATTTTVDELERDRPPSLRRQGPRRTSHLTVCPRKLIMPALVSLSAAAAVILLRFQSVVVLHTPPIAAESISDRHHLENATGQVAFRRSPPLAFNGKVDIFLDLACPDSAMAWTTLKQMVWAYEFRAEIVFRILPRPQNKLAFDTAKAVHAVQFYSADSDEVILFMDAMFKYQPLILDDADGDEARLEFRGILAKCAVATGTITEDQFESAMEASEIENRVEYDTGVAASINVRTTPTALLDGSFLVLLIGSTQLNNFRLFFAIAVESLSKDEIDLASAWDLIEGRWIVGDGDMNYSSINSGDPDGRDEA